MSPGDRILAVFAVLALTTATGWLWMHPRVREEVRFDATPIGFRINVNEADMATLGLLPRLGPTLARYILTHREQLGPFTTVEALDAVPRIGPRTIEELRPWITTECNHRTASNNDIPME